MPGGKKQCVVHKQELSVMACLVTTENLSYLRKRFWQKTLDETRLSLGGTISDFISLEENQSTIYSCL